MCFYMLQILLWRKGKVCSTCFCCPWCSAKGWRERKPTPRQAETISPLGRCGCHHHPPKLLILLKCASVWRPACLHCWSPPAWATWPKSSYKHEAPFPVLPIQPLLLICPRLEPRPFHWHNSFSHSPSLRLLLSCWHGLEQSIFGSLHL